MKPRKPELSPPAGPPTRELATSTIKETVNSALRGVLRRAEVASFVRDEHPDLRDSDVMAAAWR